MCSSSKLFVKVEEGEKGLSVGGLVANYSCGDPFFLFFFPPATVFLSFFGADRKDGTKKTTQKEASLQELETFVGRQCQLCYSANWDNVSEVGVKGDLAVRRWLNEGLSEPRAHSEVSLTL